MLGPTNSVSSANLGSRLPKPLQPGLTQDTLPTDRYTPSEHGAGLNGTSGLAMRQFGLVGGLAGAFIPASCRPNSYLPESCWPRNRQSPLLRDGVPPLPSTVSGPLSVGNVAGFGVTAGCVGTVAVAGLYLGLSPLV